MSIEDIGRAVSRVENETDYQYDDEEIGKVYEHTLRKCEINGKGNEYIPILFENELKDYIIAKAINLKGRCNYVRDMYALSV